MVGRNFKLLTLLFLSFVHDSTCLLERFELAAPNSVTWATWGETYRDKTPINGSLAVYKYKVEQGQVVRFFLVSDAPLTSPLLAVFRETTDIVSAQLPIIVQNYMYNSTARTLCPFDASGEPKPTDLMLSVEMSSYRSVSYEFSASLQEKFVLDLNTPQPFVAAVSEPVYVRFDIPEDQDSVVVRVLSNTSMCMIVSIQKIGCPVLDMDSNIISSSIHQTMSRSASITVEKSLLESFYIVFVVRPNDNGCNDIASLTPINPRRTGRRMKEFVVVVETAPTVNMYILPMLVTVGAIGIICVATITFVFAMGRYERKMMEVEARQLLHSASFESCYGAVEEEAGPSTRRQSSDNHSEADELLERSSLDSYDVLPDVRDKEVVRAKVRLTVADLSLKTWKQRDNKYKKYTVSLLTLCLFYGLPVVQLVLNWQDTVRLSGDMDLCWYNFGCSRPFLGFFDFNNIFSNIGYVSLGLLFIAMVKERDIRYQSIVKEFPGDIRNDYGLPQHNGLMYAMGIAVTMEGILSASYHICPSSANYQFDTSFMYMIGMLGMLKIYQLRHPDINANAHVSFGLMAGFIVLAMCGVYFNDLWFWIVFTVCYITTMFAISVEFYFKGQWRLSFREMWHSIKYAFLSSRRCSCVIPTYKSRFLFLVLANGVNLGYVIWGVLKRPKDFPSFLLFPFIANLFLYLLYYIIMKFVHRESLRARAMAYLGIAAVCWLTAMWFFIHNVTDWSVTPASSRELNQPCQLLDFYDNHDIWHFLSSVAIFMSFSLLLCIDDDLMWVRRDRIVVF